MQTQTTPGLHQLSLIIPPDQTVSAQPLERNMPAVIRKLVTDDVYEQACSKTAWQQLYDQITPGMYQGELAEFWLDGIQFFHETSSHALRRSCIVWPGSIWFGVPQTNTDNSYVHFFKVQSDSITTHSGGREFELLTAPGFGMNGIVLPEEELFDCFSQQTSRDIQTIFRSERYCRQIDLHKKRLFCRLLSEIAGKIEHDPAVLQSEKIRIALKESMLHALADLLLTGQEGARIKKSQQAYRQIVSRARDYLLAHQNHSASIPDLCDYLHISRRTLQNAFHAVLNISPVHFLKSLRLNAVRRELLSATSVFPNIQETATAWGFNHMSQFAIDYSQFFGELPSETLLRKGRFFRRFIVECESEKQN